MKTYYEDRIPDEVWFGSILQIIIVLLKLCGVIDWSWWWVFAPTWVPFALVLFMLVIFLIVDKD